MRYRGDAADAVASENATQQHFVTASRNRTSACPPGEARPWRSGSRSGFALASVNSGGATVCWLVCESRLINRPRQAAAAGYRRSSSRCPPARVCVVDFPAPEMPVTTSTRSVPDPAATPPAVTGVAAELDEFGGELGPAAAWKLWPTGHHLTWRQQSAHEWQPAKQDQPLYAGANRRSIAGTHHRGVGPWLRRSASRRR